MTSSVESTKEDDMSDLNYWKSRMRELSPRTQEFLQDWIWEEERRIGRFISHTNEQFPDSRFSKEIDELSYGMCLIRQLCIELTQDE